MSFHEPSDSEEMIASRSSSGISSSDEMNSMRMSSSSETIDESSNSNESCVRLNKNVSTDGKNTLKHKLELEGSESGISAKKSKLSNFELIDTKMVKGRDKETKLEQHTASQMSAEGKFKSSKENSIDQLTIEKVKIGLMNGDIVTCEPFRKSKNHQIYDVCKRLKYGYTGKRIAHFLFCSKCSSVLNINLSTHYRWLRRHYENCTGISVKVEEKDHVAFDRAELRRFIEQVMKIGCERGVTTLKQMEIPKVMNGHNIDMFLNKLKKNGSKN